MAHSSVSLETPIEFINITPLNPLISKCQIKVVMFKIHQIEMVVSLLKKLREKLQIVFLVVQL